MFITNATGPVKMMGVAQDPDEPKKELSWDTLQQFCMLMGMKRKPLLPVLPGDELPPEDYVYEYYVTGFEDKKVPCLTVGLNRNAVSATKPLRVCTSPAFPVVQHDDFYNDTGDAIAALKELLANIQTWEAGYEAGRMVSTDE